jgi:hypothetical protein
MHQAAFVNKNVTVSNLFFLIANFLFNLKLYIIILLPVQSIEKEKIFSNLSGLKCFIIQCMISDSCRPAALNKSFWDRRIESCRPSAVQNLQLTNGFVCGPYNAKLLHCRLINVIPKNHQHISIPNLCPHLPSNVH